MTQLLLKLLHCSNFWIRAQMSPTLLLGKFATVLLGQDVNLHLEERSFCFVLLLLLLLVSAW